MSEKREFRIDSSDSMRPAATINDEPHYFAQGLKPKARAAVKSEISENAKGELVRKTTYNDGVFVESQIHADHPEVLAKKAQEKAIRVPKKPTSKE